jgi:hypothetical protein
MSENTHTPEVGQIWITENTDDKTLTYYKITKLSAKMVWYFNYSEHSIATHRQHVKKIWTKNIATMLGEPLSIYKARKEAERDAKVLQAMHNSHEKYSEVYKALS